MALRTSTRRSRSTLHRAQPYCSNRVVPSAAWRCRRRWCQRNSAQRIFAPSAGGRQSATTAVGLRHRIGSDRTRTVAAASVNVALVQPYLPASDQSVWQTNREMWLMPCGFPLPFVLDVGNTDPCCHVDVEPVARRRLDEHHRVVSIARPRDPLISDSSLVQPAAAIREPGRTPARSRNRCSATRTDSDRRTSTDPRTGPAAAAGGGGLGGGGLGGGGSAAADRRRRSAAAAVGGGGHVGGGGGSAAAESAVADSAAAESAVAVGGGGFGDGGGAAQSTPLLTTRQVSIVSWPSASL